MEDHLQYRYKTIVFEFQKDGLLGDRFIDGDSVENRLNIMGKSGWELVNVAPVHDGLLAFLKKTYRPIKRHGSTRPDGSPQLGPVSSQPSANTRYTQGRPLTKKSPQRTGEEPPSGGNAIGDIKIE